VTTAFDVIRRGLDFDSDDDSIRDDRDSALQMLEDLEATGVLDAASRLRWASIRDSWRQLYGALHAITTLEVTVDSNPAERFAEVRRMARVALGTVEKPDGF